MNLEDLVLIILNYNSANDTLRCLEILRSFNMNFQIIVVDNNSTDNSKELLKNIEDPQTTFLISDENRGYGAGNNIGIHFAENNFSSNIIGIINPDIIIPNQEVIISMYNVLKNSDFAMVGGSVIDNEGNYRLLNSSWDLPSFKSVVLERFLIYNRHKVPYCLKMYNDETAIVECVAGCFFMIKADVMKEIGYFDENVFLYNEENIIGMKLREKGFQSIILTKQFYYHLHDFEKDKVELSLSKKCKRDWVKFLSRKYFAEKYYSKFLGFLLFFVEIFNLFQIMIGHLKNNIIKKKLKGNSSEKK